LSETVSIKKNFIFSFGEKLLRAALIFISLGIVARYLGPSQYGTLSYLLALVSYFQLLGAFGLDQVLMRLYVNRPEAMRETYWETIIVKTIFSLVGILLYLLFLFYNNEANFLSILFGVAILASVFDNNRIFLETQNKHHVVAKIEMIYQILSAILKIGLVKFDLGVHFIFTIFVIDFFFTKFVMFLSVRRDIFPIQKLKINFEQIIFYIKAGGFHCLSGIFVVLGMKIDQVMVGQILGMEPLGNYSAAVRISDAWYFIPMTASSLLFPSALKEQTKEHNRFIQIIFDFTFWISVFIFGVALFFNEKIFYLMFGNKFIIDKLVLNILFLNGLFVAFGISTGVWLNVKGDRRIYFFRSFIGASTNVLLNLFLIPRWGLVGCSLSSLISYGITFLVTFSHKDSAICIIYIKESLNPFRSLKRVLSLRN
jgi:O-antigen/teichoic acid export membrane protein